MAKNHLCDQKSVDDYIYIIHFSVWGRSHTEWPSHRKDLRWSWQSWTSKSHPFVEKQTCFTTKAFQGKWFVHQTAMEASSVSLRSFLPQMDSGVLTTVTGLTTIVTGLRTQEDCYFPLWILVVVCQSPNQMQYIGALDKPLRFIFCVISWLNILVSPA